MWYRMIFTVKSYDLKFCGLSFCSRWSILRSVDPEVRIVGFLQTEEKLYAAMEVESQGFPAKKSFPVPGGTNLLLQRIDHPGGGKAMGLS